MDDWKTRYWEAGRLLDSYVYTCSDCGDGRLIADQTEHNDWHSDQQS